MIGESVRCSVELHNDEAEPHRVLVDFRVWFVKANGSDVTEGLQGRPRQRSRPGATVTVSKKLSLQQHSTRTHHPGDHVVEVLVNGEARPVGTFVLR